MRVDSVRIETMLAEREMTKRRLSTLCGISAQNLSTIIRRGTCTPKSAGRIAKGLGVSVEAVLLAEKRTE